VYALILMVVILWRPSGLLGVLTGLWSRAFGSRPAPVPGLAAE
jgi:hypothetical protein